MMRKIFVTAVALGAFWNGLATAGEWPQWRGPQRSGHAAADERVPRRLAGARPVWTVPAGDGLASPVLSGGKVFYLDNQRHKEVVHAVDAASGRPIWRHELDEAFKDSQSPAGPRCTPVVDGERIYAQSCRGELHCLNVADGAVVWRADYVEDFGAVFIGERGQAEGARRHGYNGAPLVHGDRLIALVGGKEGAGVVCFDKREGTVIWKSQEDTPAYAPPIVATIAGREQVVAFTVQGVIGLDVADGALLWRVPVKTAFGRHVTTPVVVDDVVVVASHQVGLIGIRVTKDGARLTAEPIWTERDLAINFSSPVAVGQHLYGLGPSKNLMCVDVKTGKQAWSQGGFASGGADKAHAGIVAVEGSRLLVLTDGGEAVMVAADPSGYRELGRVQVCGRNWCNPAYADGKLVVRDGREVRSVALTGE
jgi:outer membrane protein assembly factor BamB